MAKFYSDSKAVIFNGDCLEVMKKLPADSIDAMVTDPPYELSDSSKASPNRVFFEFMFPDDSKLQSVGSTESDLLPLLREIFGLCGIDVFPTESSAMPVRSVAFNDQISVGNKIVEDKGVSSVQVPDGKRVGSRNPKISQYGTYGFFKLADFAQLFKILNAVICQFDSGGIGIGFGITSSSFPTFLSEGFSVNLTDQHIRILNNSFSKFVSTGGRAENFFVSRLDLGRGTIEFASAYSALIFFSVLYLAGAKLVTTTSATGSFSTKLKSGQTCQISGLANWALPFDFFVHTINIRQSGFMGKEWDGSKVAYNVELWQEAYRILKPGAHLLAFGGTRTYHRLVSSIEDAGFEIRDQIQWLYGCLSEDTQIVTEAGVCSYDTIEAGTKVLCYDIYSKEFSYQPVEEKYEYAIKDTAYRIQSDFTDQLVSRNHRVIVERKGTEIFEFAENLQEKEIVPILEGVPYLPKTVSDFQQRTDNPEQDLLQSVYRETYQQDLETKTSYIGFKPFGESKSQVFSLRERVLQKYQASFTSWSSLLWKKVQWSPARAGVEKVWSSGQTELGSCFRGSSQNTNDRRQKPRLERWSVLQKKSWKLWWSKVCSLSQGILGNGTERRLCYGTPTDCSTGNWEMPDSIRISSPYQPQLVGQQASEPDAIQKQSRPQTLRRWRGYKTTLATVTPIEYEGKVWCVKVPTGAFVAVRNGKFFVTGNSGFPKSLNVSKAIDKMAGAEREVIGQSNRGSGAQPSKLSNHAKGDTGIGYMDGSGKTFEITAPATDSAKQWEGWGTALKPANEPICLARKPISESTVAENVLKWGTGALNIDGCRVGTDTIKIAHNKGNSFSQSYKEKGEQSHHSHYTEQVGRWPANVILSHHPECKPTGQKVVAKGSVRQPTGKKILDPDTGWNQNSMVDETVRGYGDEEVEIWDCHPDCPFKLFPNSKSTGGSGAASRNWKGDGHTVGASCQATGGFGDNGSAARFFYCAKASRSEREAGLENHEDKLFGFSGGAQQALKSGKDEYIQEGHVGLNKIKRLKNNHPTVKPIKLMEYLIKLVTPPNGVVLDPFMGSGTTLIAARNLGFRSIGIEKEEGYCEIAKGRLNGK